MSALLEVIGLGVRYGGVQAVTDVSFKLEAGRIVTVLGPNGAGKTSLLRGIGGLVRSSGQVRFDGLELRTTPAAQRAQVGIGHVLEGRHVFPDLSVDDNLRLGALLSKEPAVELENVFEVLPELYGHRQRKAGSLSGGQQQMLAIGRALAGSPRLLLLDEPTNGLAPMLVDRVGEVIGAIQARGVAVLLVEQRLEMTRKLDSDVLILRRGEHFGSTHTSDPSLEEQMHATYLA